MEHLFIKSNADTTKLMNDLSVAIKQKLVAMVYNSGVLKVFVEPALTPEEYSELQTIVLNHDPNRAPTPEEIKQQDFLRFKNRAAKKDEIISSMASDNLERVRNGIWTAGDLVSLTQDPELKNILDDVNTLSYEIAYIKIDGLTNSLITPEIKANWKQLLLDNFFI